MVVEIASLSLLVPLVSSAIIGIISTIQNSKCSKISMCCGLLSCIRNTGNPDDDIIESVSPNDFTKSKNDFTKSNNETSIN